MMNRKLLIKVALSFFVFTISAGIAQAGIDDIIDKFEDFVAEGDIVGNGPGNSAKGRLKAFGNMLDEAKDFIDAGNYTEACILLEDALERCDGEFPPPDFITDEEGDANLQMADSIENLMNSICTVSSPSITIEMLSEGIYRVTNTGSVSLDNIVVNDEQGEDVTCPQTYLDPGESMICVVSTQGLELVILMLSDGIYLVINTGNVTLDNIIVTDEQGEDIPCPQTTLDPGESMTCPIF